MARLKYDPRIKTLWGPRNPNHQPGQDTFDKFLQLPQELQDHIWHLFCPDLIHPRALPMVWCYQKCEHKAKHGSVCMKTVGLHDHFPSFERSTRSFRIYSAVSKATRARALASAPDVLEFCGCWREPTWDEIRESTAKTEPNKANGFFRYNASRDVIHVINTQETCKNERTPMPDAPHVKVCRGEKRTFQEGRLGPRHVAIGGVPLDYEGVSAVQLAEALSCVFPGCHTFYHGWEPHQFRENDHQDEDCTIPFEGDNLGEVAWLASSCVNRVAYRLPNSWDETRDGMSYTWCWVNAETHPGFTESLPYRRFALAEQLKREVTLTEELRKRSFNTSYMMELCHNWTCENPYIYYDPEYKSREWHEDIFDIIVERVKGRTEQKQDAQQ